MCIYTYIYLCINMYIKAHGMTVSPAPITINHPYIHASYPVMPNYMQVRIRMMQTNKKKIVSNRKTTNPTYYKNKTNFDKNIIKYKINVCT